MKIRQRDCQGEADKYLMLALAHARPEDNLHVVDLPYRPDAPPDMHRRLLVYAELFAAIPV